MAHLPLSYKDRCLRTWFAVPNVNYYRDNPMHVCSQSRNHLGTCVCNCSVDEGIASTGESRNKSGQESDKSGSDSSENLRMD
jgi:hypothetical protein